MKIELHWDVSQGSEEWIALHEGRLTASDASKLITSSGKPSSQRNELLGRVVAETLGLQHTEIVPFSNVWMERGLELEPEGRDWFCFQNNVEVNQIGFVSGRFIGCSPDGIVADDSGFHIPLEIKCPKPSTHIKWLLNNKLPPEHMAQVHMQMALLEAPYGWFMSYHPQMEPLLIKVEASVFTTRLLDELLTFQHDADLLIKKYGDTE